MAATRSLRRANSSDIVLVSIFMAALEARYEYQPPLVLSPMEPTRADMLAMTAGRSLRWGADGVCVCGGGAERERSGK